MISRETEISREDVRDFAMTRGEDCHLVKFHYVKKKKTKM